jgi:branched-chain amino acid transport system ATP-binding protein
MLAIGQALMAKPSLLLLDEPSLGLAPRNARQIRDIIVEINRQGTGVLLVEQNARMALSIADHAYVLENGKVVKDGPPPSCRRPGHPRVLPGHRRGGRRSFRDVKSYRRKKRWSA